jgi:rhamnogalacturonan endolyase
MVLIYLVSFLVLACASAQPGKPFLIKINDQTHVIGNDIWNLTIGPSFGKKLYYKGVDLVGRAASGHYASYSTQIKPVTGA